MDSQRGRLLKPAARAGKPKAITATARKLAIVVYRVPSGDLVYQDPGAIAIGIAVGEAIRYLARVSDETGTTHDQEKALFQIISTMGKPIIYAPTALSRGFPVFTLFQLRANPEIRLLTVLIIAAAFVNDLLPPLAMLAASHVIICRICSTSSWAKILARNRAL